MRTAMKYGVAALLPSLLASSAAHAAGFYIQESSVSALGSAFAGSVSSINDASTVYFNPAGMTELTGRQVQLGVNLLVPEATLTDTGSTFNGVAISGGDGGNPYNPTPVPNLYFATPLGESGVWAGIGVTAPYGLASDYGQTWFGRFDSTETELTTINVSPVLAYKVNNRLSIGGGIDIQYADATLEQRATTGGPVGISKLEGDDISWGYNIGITYKPWDGTKLGAHYRSAIDQKIDGNISLSGGTGSDFATNGIANLELPDIATFGITQDVSPDWRVMGQLLWYGWNQFEGITAISDAGATLTNIPQGYQNTLAFSLGTEFDYSTEWTLRAGYQYDPTPTTDQFRTSRTPDGDRNWFTTGATYHYSDRTSFDLAAVYIDVGNETINVSRNGGLAQVRADSEGRVGILSAAINYKF